MINFNMQWDTSGVDVRFRTVTTTYFRGAKGIFIVYDPQNKASCSIELAIKISDGDRASSI